MQTKYTAVAADGQDHTVSYLSTAPSCLPTDRDTDEAMSLDKRFCMF